MGLIFCFKCFFRYLCTHMHHIFTHAHACTTSSHMPTHAPLLHRCTGMHHIFTHAHACTTSSHRYTHAPHLHTCTRICTISSYIACTIYSHMYLLCTHALHLHMNKHAPCTSSHLLTHAPHLHTCWRLHYIFTHALACTTSSHMPHIFTYAHEVFVKVLLVCVDKSFLKIVSMMKIL